MYNFQNALSELFNLGKKYLTNLDKSQSLTSFRTFFMVQKVLIFLYQKYSN